MAELAAGGSGELTFWLIIIVTIPLEFTRAMMASVTPVLRLLTVFVNTELPPDCTTFTYQLWSHDKAGHWSGGGVTAT